MLSEVVEMALGSELEPGSGQRVPPQTFGQSGIGVWGGW
jgi:hypothetical protein